MVGHHECALNLQFANKKKRPGILKAIDPNDSITRFFKVTHLRWLNDLFWG